MHIIIDYRPFAFNAFVTKYKYNI